MAQTDEDHCQALLWCDAVQFDAIHGQSKPTNSGSYNHSPLRAPFQKAPARCLKFLSLVPFVATKPVRGAIGDAFAPSQVLEVGSSEVRAHPRLPIARYAYAESRVKLH